jgi:hypothetical protein
MIKIDPTSGAITFTGPVVMGRWVKSASTPDPILEAFKEALHQACHQRDGNGSLLCSSCKEPYPYAEPPASGPFRCYSCRQGY